MEIDGETVEIVSDFIFLGSKITADGDCSHEIKRRLLLGGKVMINLAGAVTGAPILPPGSRRPGLCTQAHQGANVFLSAVSTFAKHLRKLASNTVI